MKKRLPRKLKKKLKKDGVWRLMQASIPIVKRLYEYPSRKSLTGFITVGFRKEASENAEHTPYKLIGVDNPEDSQKLINEARYKFKNGTNNKNKNQQ